jgi:hypothetical protein
MVQRLWRGVIDVLKRAQMALDLPRLASRAKLRLVAVARGVAGPFSKRSCPPCDEIATTGPACIDYGRRRKQQKMPRKKTAHRTPWTKEDVRELKVHSKARTPVSKIAKAMKRTEGAIRQKALVIGIGVGHRR